MNIHEILQEVTNAATREARVAILKKNNCLALRDILKGAFDDTVVWDLPAGVPQFETSVSMEGHTVTALNRQTPMLRYLVKGHPAGAPLKPARKERMFLQILEGIPKNEAEVVVAMKEKKLQKRYKNVTKDLVVEAFPKLLAPGQKPAPPAKAERKPTPQGATPGTPKPELPPKEEAPATKVS